MSSFIPNKPEKIVNVQITAREAHLLKIIRKYAFGRITVYKANGILIRVEPVESQLLNEDEGIDL